MKGATTVLSATVLVVRLPIQLNSVLVRVQQLIVSTPYACIFFIHVAQPPRITSQPQEQLSVGENTIHERYHTHSLLFVAEPPKVITHPQDMKNTFQGKPVMFTIQATGTEPLRYQWERKPKKKWGRSGKWQPCLAEWCDGATLTIPSVQKSDEGSYRCVISNDIGSHTSNPANLSVGKNHPMLEMLTYIMCCFFLLCAAESSRVTTPAKLSGKSSTICRV